MKTPAQIERNKKYLEGTIDDNRKIAQDSNDPVDRGIVIGLENAYMLMFDEVYGTSEETN
jgi:hypothetical protein